MTDAATPKPGNMLTRDDTFFGVCQSLGEDFGFHPNWLRLGLALALFWNPVAAIAFYVGAGVVVAFSRWMVPGSAAPEAQPTSEKPAEDAAPEADTGEEETDDMPMAA